MESLLPSDQGEGNEVDLLTTMIYALHPEEDKPLGKVEPTDSIAESNVIFVHHELDGDPSSDMPNFNSEEVGYVDFLGIEDILLNSPNNDCC